MNMIMTISTRTRHLQGGLSLVELMVTLSVLAVILGLGVPGLTSFIQGNRLTGTANEMLAAISLARAEAVTKSINTVFCRSDDGSSCVNGSGAWQGWLVFIDRNGNGNPNGANEILRSGLIDGGTLKVTASSNIANNRITFRPSGFAQTATGAPLDGKLSVCRQSSDIKENIREVAIRVGSRVAVSRINGGGACPTPSNL